MMDHVVNDNEVLTFRLAKEEYGISILQVQEIRGYEAPTRLANAPDFLKGVINLRGSIVPVVDMRIRFGVAAPTYDALTVVIVLNIAHHTIGMVVDSVSDVVTLTPEQIRPAPAMGASQGAGHLRGLGTIDDRMLILLDIEALMQSDEFGLINPLPHAA